MSWAAVIIGGAAVVGGIASSVMAADAAEAQAEAYSSSERMQLEYLKSIRRDISEAVDAGLIDLDEGFNMALAELDPLTDLGALDSYMKLLQDPSAVMERPSTQYMYNQGVDALQAAYSKSSGGGVSGPSLLAATEYGQNYAAEALDRELERLTPLVNIETGAITNKANIQQGRGQSKANLRVSGATGSGEITSSLVPSVASSITGQGSASAQGSINQANILNSVLGQLGLLGAYKVSGAELFKGED